MQYDYTISKVHSKCLNYLQWTRPAQGRDNLVGGLRVNFKKQDSEFKK